MVVEAVRLQQVDNVEAVCTAWSRVLNSEIVPLCISTSSIVRFQYQVVFELVHLNRSPEVP